MEELMAILARLFRLNIKHFCCIYTLRRFYISIMANTYLNLTYFATTISRITLARLTYTDHKHIDVAPTRTVLSVTVIKTISSFTIVFDIETIEGQHWKTTQKYSYLSKYLSF